MQMFDDGAVLTSLASLVYMSIDNYAFEQMSDDGACCVSCVMDRQHDYLQIFVLCVCARARGRARSFFARHDADLLSCARACSPPTLHDPVKKWCTSKNRARNGRKNIQFLVRNGRSPMAAVKGIFGR